MRIKWISSYKLQDFLHDKGIYPVYVSTGGYAAYKKDKKYYEAVEAFNTQCCFYNSHKIQR